MLTISPEASAAIQQLVDVAELPASGGMRIAQGSETPEGTAVELSLVEAPDDLDVVVSVEPASVYVDHALSDLLADATLDAEMREGQVAFSLVHEKEDAEPPAAPSMNGSAPS